MTFSSRQWRGATRWTNRTAQASSSSKTATSNGSRPAQVACSTVAVIAPRTKFDPVSLVRTR